MIILDVGVFIQMISRMFSSIFGLFDRIVFNWDSNSYLQTSMSGLIFAFLLIYALIAMFWRGPRV